MIKRHYEIKQVCIIDKLCHIELYINISVHLKGNGIEVTELAVRLVHLTNALGHGVFLKKMWTFASTAKRKWKDSVEIWKKYSILKKKLNKIRLLDCCAYNNISKSWCHIVFVNGTVYVYWGNKRHIFVLITLFT